MLRPPRCISLDAGGIRIIATVAFLDELITDAKVNLTDVFTTFIGTSAGGILAGLLSTFDFKTTPYPCLIRLFLPIVRRVFVYKSCTYPVLYAKYDNQALRTMCRTVFGDRIFYSPHQPRALITAFSLSEKKLTVFDSHDPLHHDVPLVDVCMATAALPSYFSPHAIGQNYYIDGAIKSANPLLYTMFHSPDPTTTYLSVGTGRVSPYHTIDGKAAANWGLGRWMYEGLSDLIMDNADNMVVIHRFLDTRLLRLDLAEPTVLEGSNAIDDISNENITALVNSGKHMYWSNRTRLWDFLGLGTCTPRT